MAHLKQHDLESSDHPDVNALGAAAGDVLVWTPDIGFMVGFDPDLLELDLDELDPTNGWWTASPQTGTGTVESGSRAFAYMMG